MSIFSMLLTECLVETITIISNLIVDSEIKQRISVQVDKSFKIVFTEIVVRVKTAVSDTQETHVFVFSTASFGDTHVKHGLK